MKLKSNKQRRAEIKQRRLERAAQIEAQLRTTDGRDLRAAGMVPADQSVLARHNNSYFLPTCYLDRAFTCRDCGAEEVWTAKQQKWWYEVVHGAIDSTAVRCLACRRALRAQRQESQAHAGANLLAEEGERLRVLAEAEPTADALAQVEVALQSKWWSLRVVAIEVLGRWGGAVQIAQLEALVAARTKGWHAWECVAADAAAKALARRNVPR